MASKNEPYVIVDFRDRPHYYSPVGSSFSVTFEESISDSGEPVLVRTGETDNYSYIQASLPDSLVYNIINRFLRGDESALVGSVGRFADITGAPTNLHEAQKMIKHAETEFLKLPPDFRAEFGGTVEGLLAAISSGTFNDTLKKFDKSVPPVPDTLEVKPVES